MRNRIYAYLVISLSLLACQPSVDVHVPPTLPEVEGPWIRSTNGATAPHWIACRFDGEGGELFVPVSEVKPGSTVTIESDICKKQ